MELDKLSKLSGLKIEEKDKDFFIQSLTGVIQMMDEISEMKAETKNTNLEKSIVLDSIEQIDSEIKHPKETIKIDREKHYKGIQLEQGVFLAPKVIKKD
jgi:Asp-tRNA(Asn)/Glu-tRNA(Gln) amidotransferase C subunit